MAAPSAAPLPPLPAVPPPPPGSRFLVFGGKTGWVGGKLMALLAAAGYDVVAAAARLQNTQDVAAELDAVAPTHVLNAAGLTGRPNVDWCEDHKRAVIETNVTGTLALMEATAARGIHVTHFATGCIYSYDGAHPLGAPGFTEEDPPNFTGSYYSKTKAAVEDLIRSAYDHVLTLRLRMPISDDLTPRSFITKITRYERVVNIPNSMSVLAELLPHSVTLACRRVTGVVNFTNPGVISHNQILLLYRTYIQPDFIWTNFTEEEQAAVIKAPRSNNCLDTTKLEGLLAPAVLTPIQEAVEGVFRRMAAACRTAATATALPAVIPRRIAAPMAEGGEDGSGTVEV